MLMGANDNALKSTGRTKAKELLIRIGNTLSTASSFSISMHLNRRVATYLLVFKLRGDSKALSVNIR